MCCRCFWDHTSMLRKALVSLFIVLLAKLKLSFWNLHIFFIQVCLEWSLINCLLDLKHWGGKEKVKVQDPTLLTGGFGLHWPTVQFCHLSSHEKKQQLLDETEHLDKPQAFCNQMGWWSNIWTLATSKRKMFWNALHNLRFEYKSAFRS